MEQRVNEMRWLRDPSFLQAADDAGFRLVSPSELIGTRWQSRQCA
jgi:hypothetical protein